jgi:hypothetical protein
MGDEKCVKGVIGKREGTRKIATPRHNSEDNIKRDLRGRGWEL